MSVDDRHPAGGSRRSALGLMSRCILRTSFVRVSGDISHRILDERFVRLVFAGVATVVGIATIATRNDDAVDWSLVAPTVVAFWGWAGLERFPNSLLYLLGFGAPIALNLVESDNEVSMFLVVITAAVVASMERDRVWSASLLVIVTITVFVLGITGAIVEFAWANWLFGIGFAWGFGELAYRYTSTIGELEHARSLVADQAALHERRRIARDVHDLVGHSLSVVMLHVTGARHLLYKDPAEAERALEQAEAAGRSSLAEIRRTVGMLREDSDDSSPPAPSPDLCDVANLIDEYRLGAVDISLDIDGDVDQVDVTSGLAGYRIIQEALTNVTRHTIGAVVRVAIVVGDRTYDLVVENSDGENLDTANRSGFGLISMRERAKSVGGLLVAGPTPTGWIVEATLPIESVAVAP